MKLSRTTLPWVAWIVLLPFFVVSAIQVREPENETEIPPSTSSPAALSATEPSDNGMAVGEAPEVEPTASNVSPTSQIAIQTEVYVPSASASPTVDAVFPENHRNSSNPSLGTIESPPFLNNYNKYQQQYREYYNQKSQYIATARPFKFEDTNSDFVPSVQNNGLSSYGEEPQVDDSIKFRNKPFPYFFEELNSKEPIKQQAYPIPQQNLIDTSFSEDTEENHGSVTSPSGALLPSTASFMSSFGFPFANLFGAPKKPPANLHSSQGHRSEVTKHKGNASWKKVLKVLSTVVPLGLFIATLTPNLLYVNTTSENRPSRVRSLDDHGITNIDDPLEEIVQRLGGWEAMKDPLCEDRFFCEMSILGKNNQSSYVEKGFWYLANETPDNVAEEVGMKELFQAVKTNNCETFVCKSIKEEKPSESQHVTKQELKENKKTRPKKFKGS